MTLSTVQTTTVTITDKAVEELKRAMEQQDKADHGLRLSVLAGGCSGYSYGLTFEKESNGHDQSFEANGITVYVDEDDAQLLKGVEIDYEQSMMGGGFKISNPNAVSSCGCGQSFN